MKHFLHLQWHWHLQIGQIYQLLHAQYVRFGFTKFCHRRWLLLEIGLVVVMWVKNFVFFTYVLCQPGVFHQHWNQREKVESSEGKIITFIYFKFLGQTLGDGLYLEILISQDEHLILFVSLEHSDVLDLPLTSEIVFVEFEARSEVPFTCQRHHFLHRVELLIISFSFLHPSQEHCVMELPNRRRKEAIQRIVYNLSRFVIEISVEVVAHFSNQHFLLVTTDWDETGVLFKEHDWIIECLLLCGFIDEVVSCFEYGVVLYAVAEILESGWFQLLVFDEYAETEKVELPSSVYAEIISYFGPVLVQLINKIKIRPNSIEHIWQKHFVSLNIFPE